MYFSFPVLVSDLDTSNNDATIRFDSFNCLDLAQVKFISIKIGL